MDVTHLHHEEDEAVLSWLETVWNYLRQHYPSNLSSVIGLPILAVRSDDHTAIHILSSPSKVALQSAKGYTISEGVQEGLCCLGVELVSELHPAVANHAAVLGKYVYVPQAEDLLKAALVAQATTDKRALENFGMNASSTSRNELCDLWAKLVPGKLSAKGKTYLTHLPLFKIMGKVGDPVEFTSVAAVGLAAPLEMPPVPAPTRMLDLKDEAPKMLAKLLGIKPMKLSQYFSQHVFPNLHLLREDKESILKNKDYVMDRLCLLVKEDSGFKNCLSQLPFVENASGEYKVPSDLFDPEDEFVKKFFIGDDMFPGGRYQQPEFLVFLRQLGLQGAAQIQAKHVLMSVRSLQQQAAAAGDDKNACMNKAKTIFQHLSDNADQLRESVNGQTLHALIQNMAWVPTQQQKPKLYPKNLPWFKAPSLEVPKIVFSPDWSSLIGSVAPVMLSVPTITLAEAFSWHQPPSLDLVLKQLKVSIQQYVPVDKAKFMTIISAIYDCLSSESSRHLQESLTAAGLASWIWNGEGFSEPKSIVVKKCQLDLSPYCYTLPSEIAMYKDMFVCNGAAREVTDEVLVMVLTSVKNKYSLEIDQDGAELSSPKIEKTDCARDLQMSNDILNILKLHVTDMSAELLGCVLVPVQTELEIVCLLPIKDCTYCDIEWLRQGVHSMPLDESDGIRFIHPNLPVPTAEALGVPTLMSRMLHADEFEVTGWGQQESLTSRLHQLLEDYTDGFAIPKELVQNADDGGATTVKFLYDERSNERYMTQLLDEGMKHCQGPALWVYNDAVFTDQDFHNITKLGGATKETELDKIGRFGLGFNAVYNITDVPSFLSRNYLMIFDPHMTHLGHAMKDRTRPGIRIDLARHRTLIRKLPDQFEPYRKVFGCEIGSEAENHFGGTLFRFPLRDQQQGKKSEISTLHYDKKEMTDLLSLLVQGAQNLLLFTQNVKTIEVFHLPPGENNPENAREILVIQKDVLNTFNMTGNMDSSNALSSMLSVGAKYMDDIKGGKRKFKKSQIPSATSVVKMSVSVSNNGELLTSQEAGTTEQLWLISTTVGQKQSLSHRHDSLIPVASVAAPLCRNDNLLQAVPVESIGQKGRLFCFLPLPIESGLPVHVNGAFAVQSNRRYLCEQTEDDKFCSKAEWNKALLQDAVVFAYEKLMLSICQWDQNDCTQYIQLWPNMTDAKSNMHSLVHGFYGRLTEDAQSIPVCYDGNRQVRLSEVILLDSALREKPQIGEKAIAIFQKYFCDDPFAFDLPDTVRHSFEVTGHDQFIDKKTWNEIAFFKKVFFKQIADIDAVSRDTLMCYILDEEDDNLTGIAKTSPCIPVSPEGKKLKYPNETIHPEESAALLYGPEDERFPFGDVYCTPGRLSALEKLGMQTSDLHWEDVYERAGSIATMKETDLNKMKKRQLVLLEFLNLKLNKTPNEKRGGDAAQTRTVKETADENLQKIPFLSPMKKPENFPLPWHGEDSDQDILLAAESMYPKESLHLLSCSQYIADEEEVKPKVQSLLGLTKKKVQTKSVQIQFEQMLQTDMKNLNPKQHKTLKCVYYAVYDYLQRKCKNEPQFEEKIRNEYQDKPCIYVEHKYVKPSEVAFKYNSDCTPFLYCIPSAHVKNFGHIYSILGVRKMFGEKDYVAALQQMQNENSSKQLNSEHLGKAISLVHDLDECMSTGQINVKQVCQQYGTIYIPDSHGILQDSTTLCYNDCSWLPDSNQAKFTHPGITQISSQHLGVKTQRQQALTPHSHGIPFGQKEDLVDSLKRILHSYPLDSGILKEFIQNADDAEATQMHFVIDERTHPSDRIFDGSWKPVQGPALCIYNDRPFSKIDLAGIQRVGFGSKMFDPNKTGKYGIGFCSAYHLSDVPSFLSKGDELGETLCVFDPMCKYVPGATSDEPGMRYTDLTSVRDAFPDVFSGYLEDAFSGKNSTMFRLPLRSKDMARVSDISHTPVTLMAVKAMLEELQSEALDILLFTNNLQQLHVSQISSDDNHLQDTYSVTSKLNPCDERKRSDFFSYVKQVGHQLKERLVSVEEIMLKDVTYDINLSDNRGVEELWRVCQRIGTVPHKAVPVASNDASNHGELCLLPCGLTAASKDRFRRGDICQLPCGGTACLVERRLNGVICLEGRDKKVFFSLPLPQENCLPMHINGHFAFGLENRRHLWQSQNDDYRQAWNNFLFIDLIAPCYLDMLKSMRLDSLSVHCQDDITAVLCSKETLEDAIKKYQNLFPVSNSKCKDFDVLAKAILSQSAEFDFPILPCILEEKATRFSRKNETGPAELHYVVKWLPPCGKGCKKAFFSGEDEYKQSEFLHNALKACGFNIVEANSKLKEMYEDAGVGIKLMSPAEVNLFLQRCTSDDSGGDVGELPCELDETPFASAGVLETVIEFCKSDPLFPDKLEGLPLCFTGDNQLQVFHASNPKFPAAYMNLVPESAGQFLHKKFSAKLLKDIDIDTTPVVRKFDIAAFASILHETLDQAIYCKSPVEWKIEHECILNEQWIQNVWDFCIEQYGIHDKAKWNKNEIKKTLAPLSHWCILPATCKQVHKLYCIETGEQVLDFTWLVAHFEKPNSMISFLKKLGVPEFDTSYLDEDSQNFVRNVITTFENPIGILKAVWLSIKTYKYSSSNEDLHNIRELLCYFSNHITDIKKVPGALDRLCQLPLHCTVTGDITFLNGRKVYMLPSDFRDAAKVWCSMSDTVFLSPDEMLKDLYSAIQCEQVTHMEAYCNFILQHFALIQDNQKTHLLHDLYKRFLHSTKPIEIVPASEKDNLLNRLRNLHFLKHQGRDPKLASDFFDPDVELFRTMKLEYELPPKEQEPFNEHQWLTFLRMLGLKSNVSSEMYKEFASEIACLGAHPGPEDPETKCKVLVQHLFEMDDKSYRDEILRSVAHVAFVQPERASCELQRVCNGHGVNSDGNLPYVCFNNSYSKDYEELVWTSASLLPSWADPNKQSDLESQDVAKIRECLGMHALSEPPLDLVLKHLYTLCSHIMDNLSCSSDYNLIHLFRPIYQYLQKHMKENKELLWQKLYDIPFVLIQGRMPFIKARFTVLNLGHEGEISPYLLRVPADLGEFHKLFLHIGAQNHPTVDQYASVLKCLHEKACNDVLHANELQMAYKAIKGLADTILREKEPSVQSKSLYLPDEKGQLRDVSQVFFNDAPEYYDRLQDLDMHYLFNASACGIDLRFEEVFRRLPSTLKPKYLSNYVEETLVESSRNSRSPSGLASDINEVLQSQLFQKAVARLARHEAYKTGQQLEEHALADALGRLPSIKVWGVDRLQTHLVYKSRVVSGSQLDKSCFIEKMRGAGNLDSWNIYLRQAASLSQDLQILLAISLNTILGGLLRDSALFLLPLLMCPEADMQARLDAMNVRMDRSSYAAHVRKLPAPGEAIPSLHKQWICATPGGDFRQGEFVAFKENSEADFVYAVVEEDVTSAGNDPNAIFCHISLSSQSESKACSTLHKIERKPPPACSNSASVPPQETSNQEKKAEKRPSNIGNDIKRKQAKYTM